MRMRRSVTWILAAWLMGIPAPAAAADSQIERASLTGLTTISVVVEALAPIAEKNGLATATLQTDVERRLRQAGINVTPAADACLHVHVTVADPGPSLSLPDIVDVSLRQEVTLPRGLKTRTPLQCP